MSSLPAAVLERLQNDGTFDELRTQICEELRNNVSAQFNKKRTIQSIRLHSSVAIDHPKSPGTRMFQSRKVEIDMFGMISYSSHHIQFRNFTPGKTMNKEEKNSKKKSTACGLWLLSILNSIILKSNILNSSILNTSKGV